MGLLLWGQAFISLLPLKGAVASLGQGPGAEPQARNCSIATAPMLQTLLTLTAGSGSRAELVQPELSPCITHWASFPCHQICNFLPRRDARVGRTRRGITQVLWEQQVPHTVVKKIWLHEIPQIYGGFFYHSSNKPLHYQIYFYSFFGASFKMLGIINRAIKACQNINDSTTMYYPALGTYRQPTPTVTLDFTGSFGPALQSTLNTCHAAFCEPPCL